VRIYLAHGASGSVASLRPWTEALAARGFDARAVGLPRGSAERALPVYEALLEADAQLAGDDPADCVIGGHSFGGRVASLLAAQRPLAGLVLLSYPLHRPGRPTELRVDHWPAISCPTLLLSGASDPFARLDLLQAAVGRLVDAELATYARVGHGLLPVIDAAVRRIAVFLATLPRPTG
jgi:predicted alpha/beta-hydrolase family hydrolase